MTDQSNLNYAAQITISLPSAEESVTMTVTLWPADVVNLDGELKPLGQCTLADLERLPVTLDGLLEQNPAILMMRRSGFFHA